MIRSATVQFRLPIEFKKRKKWYIASCPILDIVSQGDTKHKAKANLREALIGFIETCIELGSIGDVLRDCGFKPVPKESLEGQAIRKKQPVKSHEEFVNIPIELLSNKHSCHDQCHA